MVLACDLLTYSTWAIDVSKVGFYKDWRVSLDFIVSRGMVGIMNKNSVGSKVFYSLGLGGLQHIMVSICSLITYATFNPSDRWCYLLLL